MSSERPGASLGAVRGERWLGALPFAGLVWLWGFFFLRAHLWWNEASYYTYGWAVPLLACLLCYRVDKSSLAPVKRVREGGLAPVGWLLSLYVPLRLVAEPDPFWRFPLWLEAGLLIVLTLTWLRWLYGREAVGLFLVPCLFLLTALPWPAVLETRLVQGMTSLVTLATAEALLWMGHPAEVMGHTLNVGEQKVLISNTCSGIRSFQGLLAAALFMIAYLRLSKGVAVAVVLVSVLLAFFFNLCRAVALALISLQGGEAVYARWHDPVGYLSVAASFLAVVLIARRFRPGGRAVPLQTDMPTISGMKPRLFVLALVACIVPEALAQGWFRWVSRVEPVPHWHVQWPGQAQPIEQPVQDVLLFDYGNLARLALSDGTSATVIHFGYDGSSPGASICSRNHDPATCMGRLGTRLADGAGDVTCEVEDARLVFRHYVAGARDVRGRFPLNVWWCPWVEDPRSGAFTDPGGSLLEKGRRFLSGKLSFERKVLLVLLEGSRDSAEAEAGLREVVRMVVRPGDG